MDGKWHLVAIPPSADAMNSGWLGYNQAYMAKVKEAREWCADNTHGRWSEGSSQIMRSVDGSERRIHVTAFLFKGPNDALLFKLAFGGA